MYAIEFEAPIENGIVHIPQQYQELQQMKKAKFFVIYNDTHDTVKGNDIQSQLDEFKKLRSQSNNKITATMELATNIDELIDDGIF